ncbi:MAG: response regulator transcription factor [Pseudomonadota bacterium]
MMNASFLWVDLQHLKSPSGLFETLPKTYKSYKVTNPSYICKHIKEEKPQFLCFEFDRPQRQDLEFLQKTKQSYPELPILMIIDPHTEALAVWAFRCGVRDYLVKPCAHEYLNASIHAISQLCYYRRQDHCREPLFFPCQLSDDILNCSDQEAYKSFKTGPAIAFLEKYYTQDVRLSTVSELCGLSRSLFSRTFKKEHHINFSEYVIKMRINKACELLRKPSIQIKSVAFSVGFNDLSYFTRIFKRYLGATPSKYQRTPDSFKIH